MRFLNVTHMKRKVAQEMVRAAERAQGAALVTLMHNETSCPECHRSEDLIQSRSSSVCGPREVVPKTKTTTFEKLVYLWKHGAITVPLPAQVECRPPDNSVAAEDNWNTRKCPLYVAHRRNQFLPKTSAEMGIHSTMRSIVRTNAKKPTNQAPANSLGVKESWDGGGSD